MDLSKKRKGEAGEGAAALAILILAAGVALYSPVFCGRAIYHSVAGSWMLTETEYNMSFISPIWEGTPDKFRKPPYKDYVFYYENDYVSEINSCNISTQGTDLYLADLAYKNDILDLQDKDLKKMKSSEQNSIAAKQYSSFSNNKYMDSIYKKPNSFFYSSQTAVP